MRAPPTLAEISGLVLEIGRLQSALDDHRSRFDQAAKLYAAALPSEGIETPLVERPPQPQAKAKREKPSPADRRVSRDVLLEALRGSPTGLMTADLCRIAYPGEEISNTSRNNVLRAVHALEKLGKIRGERGENGTPARWFSGKPGKLKPSDGRRPKLSQDARQDIRVLKLLVSEGASCVSLEKGIGASNGSVSRWVSGGSVPGPELQEKIRAFLAKRDIPKPKRRPPVALAFREEVSEEIEELVRMDFCLRQISDALHVAKEAPRYWRDGRKADPALAEKLRAFLAEAKAGRVQPAKPQSLGHVNGFLVKTCVCGRTIRGPSFGAHVKKCPSAQAQQKSA